MICQWCLNLATFKVSAYRMGKPPGKPVGGHECCGKHLHRAVIYVTVPGRAAHVERLP